MPIRSPQPTGSAPEDVLLRTDSCARLCWVSPAVSDALGWTPQELIGRPMVDLIHPYDRDVIEDSAARGPDSGCQLRCFARFRDRAGAWQWLPVCPGGAPAEEPADEWGETWDEGKDPSGLSWTVVLDQPFRGSEPRRHGVEETNDAPDTTAATAADATATDTHGDYQAAGQQPGSAAHPAPSRDEVIAARDRYRLLAENASDLVAHADNDGRIQWFSPSLANYGWDPAELVGGTIARILHPDDVPLLDEVTQATRNGHATGVEWRIRDRGGDYHWFRVRLHPTRAPDGRTIGRVSGWQNIDAEVHTRQALMASEARFRNAMKATAAGVVIQRFDGAIVDTNPAAERILGLSGEHLTRRTATEPGWPAIREDGSQYPGHEQPAMMTLRTGTPVHDVVMGLTRPGQPTTWILVNSEPTCLPEHPGRPAVVTSFTDITDQRNARQAAADSEERYRLLAENASDVVVSVSAEGHFEWVSESVRQVLGWEPAQMLGRPAAWFIPPEDRDGLRQALDSVPPGTGCTAEFRFKRASGEHVWMTGRLRRAPGPDGTLRGYVGGLLNISALKAVESEFAFASAHDPLTGLPNRTSLLEATQAALQAMRHTGRGVAVLMADLDRFAVLNDSLGHEIGDQLLVAAGRRVAQVIRPGDLVARHGGDEIVVLVTGLSDPSEAVRMGERLVAAFRKPLTLPDRSVTATASVGIAVALPRPDALTSATDLIRQADVAVYSAKRAGRDRALMYQEDLQRAVDNQMDVEHNLRHALAEEQLAVWYQPEVDLMTGRVRAVEALLRWHHPDGKVRSGGQFISVAEDTGMIREMGRWVLDRVCADIRGWLQAGGDPTLTWRVNLSPVQLVQPDLLTEIDDSLRASGVPAEQLCMEITESVMLHDNPTVQDNLSGLAARGIPIAIDDFGTGYASLTYLRRYPIRVLKVDRSFIMNLATNSFDRQLVEGIVTMAAHLGLAVTAEGVETREQESALIAAGCSRAQGYLYSPAIPISSLPEFIERGLLPGPRATPSPSRRPEPKQAAPLSTAKAAKVARDQHSRGSVVPA